MLGQKTKGKNCRPPFHAPVVIEGLPSKLACGAGRWADRGTPGGIANLRRTSWQGGGAALRGWWAAWHVTRFSRRPPCCRCPHEKAGAANRDKSYTELLAGKGVRDGKGLVPSQAPNVLANITNLASSL